MNTSPILHFFKPSDNLPPGTITTEPAVIAPHRRTGQVMDLVEAFHTKHPPVVTIWEKQTTTTLIKVLAGFERTFDVLSTDLHEAQFLPPADYVTSRMAIIRSILEKRAEQRAAQPVEMRDAYDQVENGTAKRIKRYDRKGGTSV